jgi:hypothetical protein
MTDIVRVLQQAKPGRIDSKTARQAWSAFRVASGFGPVAPLLTEPAGNVKLSKTGEYSLALAPAGASGFQVCRYRTTECERHCVAFSGKGGLDMVQAARVLKTRFLAEQPDAFVTLLADEIRKAADKMARKGLAFAMRLNAFSDIPWEDVTPWLFAEMADLTFYDYTKWAADRRPNLPANYSLTQSATERTADQDLAEMVKTRNVAVIFSTSRTKALPKTFRGCTVIDGDKSDARYLDPVGVVVGLRAKGSLRKDHGGFVRAV